MPLLIHLTCDEPSCRAKTGLDTGWIDMPEGWTVGGAGEVFCPKHEEETE